MLPATLEGIRRALMPFGEVRVAWVFGSQVAGRTHAASDLDLGIAFAAGLDERRGTSSCYRSSRR